MPCGWPMERRCPRNTKRSNPESVPAILSWCLAINSWHGVLLRIVVGLGTTFNDTQMGNALGFELARFRKTNAISGCANDEGFWLKRLPTADSESLPIVLVAAMPRYEKRMSRKKASPRPSGRCGCGDLHPAPTSFLTSFLEGLLVWSLWLAASSRDDANPSCLSQLGGFIPSQYPFWTEQILYEFNGGTTEANPLAVLSSMQKETSTVRPLKVVLMDGGWRTNSSRTKVGTGKNRSFISSRATTTEACSMVG
jgi:hypothetical protein